MFQSIVKSPEETIQLAQKLASVLQVGDVLILKGELAAGKTFLVQAIARALGSEDYISSPTYTIANFYNSPIARLLHIDAYRMGSMAEFRDLGLDEYFDEVITFIEWGGKVEEDFSDYLSISFSFAEGEAEHRILEFTHEGSRWAAAMTDLQAHLL